MTDEVLEIEEREEAEYAFDENDNLVVMNGKHKSKRK